MHYTIILQCTLSILIAELPHNHFVIHWELNQYLLTAHYLVHPTQLMSLSIVLSRYAKTSGRKYFLMYNVMKMKAILIHPFTVQPVFLLSVAVLIYMKVVWDISQSVSVNNFLLTLTITCHSIFRLIWQNYMKLLYPEIGDIMHSTSSYFRMSKWWQESDEWKIYGHNHSLTPSIRTNYNFRVSFNVNCCSEHAIVVIL